MAAICGSVFRPRALPEEPTVRLSSRAHYARNQRDERRLALSEIARLKAAASTTPWAGVRRRLAAR
jgi:hypothetical protein